MTGIQKATVFSIESLPVLSVSSTDDGPGLISKMLKKLTLDDASSLEDKEASVMVKLMHFIFLQLRDEKKNKDTTAANGIEIKNVVAALSLMPVFVAQGSAVDEKYALKTSLGIAIKTLVDFVSGDALNYDEGLILSIIGMHAMLCRTLVTRPDSVAAAAAGDALIDMFSSELPFRTAAAAMYNRMSKTVLSRQVLLFAILGVFVDSAVDKPHITHIKYEAVLKGFSFFLRV